jgi:hypothetical protein
MDDDNNVMNDLTNAKFIFTKNAQNTNKMVAEDILDMFDEYKYICMWEIDANFPTSVLVDNFRSYWMRFW